MKLISTWWQYHMRDEKEKAKKLKVMESSHSTFSKAVYEGIKEYEDFLSSKSEQSLHRMPKQGCLSWGEEKGWTIAISFRDDEKMSSNIPLAKFALVKVCPHITEEQIQVVFEMCQEINHRHSTHDGYGTDLSINLKEMEAALKILGVYPLQK